MPTVPWRLATARPAALLLAAALVVTGCGGAASATTSATPSGSVDPTACAAAPAPPANQEGWTTAATEPTVFPAIVNSGGSLTCGENRLLFTFLDDADRTVASPDRAVTVAIYDLGRDGATPTQTTEGTFVWGIEGERGFYVANVTFPEAGDWGAEFTTQLNDAAPETIRMRFQVATSSPVIRVGDAAPASDTPTAASVDGDLARISTDATPDPAFYRVSVRDALAAHDPFVLVFATPKFCTSAQCGPTLDRVKAVAADFPEVTFINVEPYVMDFVDGSLKPKLDTSVDPPVLVPAQPTIDWGLLSEPWVFVVDSQGIVRGSFEGAVGEAELRAALEAVS
ncbi:MAG TPA: hypothetical protein VFW02_11015 [Candidatus Limnocylindrales bacterium]|nr:hypothetical protein [Candidatus Limnocylindrales bacterium]